MNTYVRNIILPRNEEQPENDEQTARIANGDETLQCQLTFVANAQELLARLYAEGYNIEQEREKAPRMNVAEIMDAIHGGEFRRVP